MLHWYDFLCPYSYIGQQRTAILIQRGLPVVQLPFQAHPDIPAEGLRVRSRSGPMYMQLAREAKGIGMRLKWSTYFPNTRGALAAAEWVRRHQAGAFPQFHKSLFEAHFVLGENLGDPAVIDRHATESGIDIAAWHTALADGSAGAAVRESEILGRKSGVRGTPAWLVAQQLVTGLLSAAEFERLADQGMGMNLTA